VEVWQFVLMAFLVLLPLALLADFWPDRERLDYRGGPIARVWRQQITHEPHDDAHH
jgi:hypothetical protein